MTNRRLVDTLKLPRLRQFDVKGEVLPAEDSGALVPYTPPLLHINAARPLPQAEPLPSWEAAKRAPQRTPTVAADVMVPTLQAVTTGCVTLVSTALLALALGWSWRVPLAITGLTLGLAWFWRLRLIDSLLWKVETIVRRDFTGDGVAGPPPPAHDFTLANPGEARAEAAADVRQQADEVRRTELLAFVDRCLLIGCSESAQGVKASDRAAYLRLRDVLFQLGIAKWKNPDKPKAGWSIVVSHERARQLIARHVL